MAEYLVLGYRVGCPDCNVAIECRPGESISVARLRRITIEAWNQRISTETTRDLDNKALLPCPLCGNAPKRMSVRVQAAPWSPTSTAFKVIECGLCGLTRLYSETTPYREVVALWNTRSNRSCGTEETATVAQERVQQRQQDLANPSKRNRSRKKRSQLPEVSLGGMAKENLPLEYVHYPPHYGVFMGFSKDPDSEIYLCQCAQNAVENFFHFVQEGLVRTHSAFPASLIARINMDHIPDELRYREKICHRCTMAAPSRRYCHEMYGVGFKQYYWWYVAQAYLRFGIHDLEVPHLVQFPYMPDICPAEYQRDIHAVREVATRYLDACRALCGVPDSNAIESLNDGFPVMTTAMLQDPNIIGLRKEEAQIRRRFTIKIENIVRQEFGLKKVGEGWVSETMVANIVQKILPHEQILRHYKPQWLGGLELDIYVPGLNVGIEYQGQQHFHPVKVWGGEAALKAVQIRDKKKRRLCKTHDTTLLEVTYWEPLTEAHLRSLLRDFL